MTQQALLEKRGANGSQWVTPVTELYGRRQVLLTEEITSQTAGEAITQLLALDVQEKSPITLVVSSPGGSVFDGLAIVDVMCGLESPVYTLGAGLVASMAAVVLACGCRGHRMLTPNAHVLVHQPSMMGLGGQVSDITIAAESVVRVKDQLNGLLAQACAKTPEEVERLTDRDNWLTPEGAIAFGLADGVSPKWMLS